MYIIFIFIFLFFPIDKNLQGKELNSSLKFSSNLRLLEHLYKFELKGNIPLPKRFRNILNSDSVKVAVKFDKKISSEEINMIESLGGRFNKYKGKLLHIGNIYGIEISFEMLPFLAEIPTIKRIENVLSPFQLPPIDLSAEYITAKKVWELATKERYNVTGKGVIIADFDTGVNVLHPSLFKADGSYFNWLDKDKDGEFNPSIDGVDLNENGKLDENEILNYFEGTILNVYGKVEGNDKEFQADIDWLYNDSNKNGKRDYGKENGFKENTPTYGELLFIVEDINKNKKLDLKERLISLNSSKIIAVLNSNQEETIRGKNLIETESDTDGHGTGAVGVILANHKGFNKFVGIAPDAEIVVANAYSSKSDFTYYVPWAKEKGAKIMLWEIAIPVFEFLDGSSLLEQAIDEEFNNGIIHIVPSGNLAGNNHHFSTTIIEGKRIEIRIEVPQLEYYEIGSFYSTLLWQNEPIDTFEISLISPSNNTYTFSEDIYFGEIEKGLFLYYSKEVSERNTSKVDFAILENKEKVTVGIWKLTIKKLFGMLSNKIDGFIIDDITGWGKGVAFLDYVNDETTVTSPATADYAITVASYNTRYNYENSEIEDLSSFSGRGPRIDGINIMDITAPGGIGLISLSPWGNYKWYGGTSGAAPHVAGSIALFNQIYPDYSLYEIVEKIKKHTLKDNFTGENLPNELWGYGKLLSYEPIIYEDKIKPEFTISLISNPILKELKILTIFASETLKETPTIKTTNLKKLIDTPQNTGINIWTSFYILENLNSPITIYVEGYDLVGLKGNKEELVENN